MWVMLFMLLRIIFNFYTTNVSLCCQNKVAHSHLKIQCPIFYLRYKKTWQPVLSLCYGKLLKKVYLICGLFLHLDSRCGFGDDPKHTCPCTKTNQSKIGAISDSKMLYLILGIRSIYSLLQILFPTNETDDADQPLPLACYLPCIFTKYVSKESTLCSTVPDVLLLKVISNSDE